MLLLLLSACTSGTQAALETTPRPTAPADVEPANEPGGTSPPKETAAPTSPMPTQMGTAAATKAPPVTATTVPTTAPTETATTAPSVTPRPSPTTEPGRACPDPPPLKPEYSRFYLSAKQWPRPQQSVAETHFWMARPLPGGGRILINQRFPYGWDENGRLLLHTGVDTAEDLGTPVLAVADGTVIVAQSDYSAWYGWRCDWYGHLVVIELDERWQDQPVYALYGHILNPQVQPGERVQRGQPVAEVGVGGAATSPHLHFEVRVGKNEFANTRNPMLWLDPGPTRGVIAGRLVDPEGRPWQGVPIALLSEETNEVAHSTWSYLGDPQNLANADEGWAENFVFSDVPPGSYQVITQIQDVQYSVPAFVTPGQVSAVEILTAELKLPTPQAAGETEGTAVATPDAAAVATKTVEPAPTADEGTAGATPANN